MSRRDGTAARTADDYAREAVEYYRNGRAILRSVPIREERFLDVKRVREACGTAYLAVLAAVRSFLLSRGVPPDKLPEECKAYGQALARHGARNGKVMQTFHGAYAGLHLDGYYRGFNKVETGKQAFAEARFLIERLTGQKLDGAAPPARP